LHLSLCLSPSIPALFVSPPVPPHPLHLFLCFSPYISVSLCSFLLPLPCLPLRRLSQVWIKLYLFTPMQVSFNVANNSMLLELVGIGGLVSQLLLLRPLLCLLGEKWVLILSLLSQATQQLCLGLAGNKNEVWAALTIGVLGMMSFPTLSAIKSNNSAEHEQGAVQGALFGAKALAGGLGPLVLAQIFRMFTRTDSSLPYLPGMPFVLGACIMGLCAIVAATLPKNSAKTPGGVSGKYRAGPSDLETPFCQEGSSSDSGGGSSGDHVGRASWVAVVEPTLVSYYGETGGR